MSTHLDLEEPAGGWRLYVFDTDLDCALQCGSGCHDLYDGLSNEPLRRVLEHAKTRPWWPHVTGWRVLPEVYATEAEARAAEAALIRSRLPLANTVHNGDNPHRLVFAAAPARRPVRRPQLPRPTTSARSVPVPSRRHVLAAAWAALSGLGWWGAAHIGLAGWTAPLAAVVAATVLMALAALVVAEVRGWWNSRRARRQRRRLVLRVTALVVAAGVAAVLYLLAPVLLAHLPQGAPR